MKDAEGFLAEHFRELLGLPAETRNRDNKGAIAWPKKAANDTLRLELIRDIMAFSNSPSGGTLVFGIRNGTHELEGLSKPALVSWDQTTIFEALQRHASPTPDLRVERAVIDGKSYVSIEVQEFAEIPTVCQLEGVAKSGNRAGDLILRRGALYLRTDGAQTVEMDSESLTRDLIARAMNRKGDHLLGQIANLIAPSKEPTAAPVDAYQSDREAARKAFNA